MASADAQTSDAGKVAIFGLTSNGFAEQTAAFVGPTAGAYAGTDVASLGDADDDGCPDLAVGAPGDNGPGAAGGAVYVVDGLDCDADGQPASPSWRMVAPSAGDHFGQAIAAADVNGDGHRDLIVGAPGAQDGEPGEGVAFVYLWTGGDACSVVHCAADQTCYLGTCYPACSDAADCADTTDACYAGRCAQSACDDVVCAVDEVCFEGTCFPSCSDDADCTNPQASCYDGRCASDMCDGVQCPLHQVCYRSVCYPDCDRKDDCTRKETCYRGRCAPRDCDYVICAPDEACYRGGCFPACSEDAECLQANTCKDEAACVPDDDPLLRADDSQPPRQGSGCDLGTSGAGSALAGLLVLLALGWSRRRRHRP